MFQLWKSDAWSGCVGLIYEIDCFLTVSISSPNLRLK